MYLIHTGVVPQGIWDQEIMLHCHQRQYDLLNYIMNINRSSSSSSSRRSSSSSRSSRSSNIIMTFDCQYYPTYLGNFPTQKPCVLGCRVIRALQKYWLSKKHVMIKTCVVEWAMACWEFKSLLIKKATLPVHSWIVHHGFQIPNIYILRSYECQILSFLDHQEHWDSVKTYYILNLVFENYYSWNRRGLELDVPTLLVAQTNAINGCKGPIGLMLLFCNLHCGVTNIFMLPNTFYHGKCAVDPMFTLAGATSHFPIWKTQQWYHFPIMCNIYYIWYILNKHYTTYK